MRAVRKSLLLGTVLASAPWGVLSLHAGEKAPLAVRIRRGEAGAPGIYHPDSGMFYVAVHPLKNKEGVFRKVPKCFEGACLFVGTGHSPGATVTGTLQHGGDTYEFRLILDRDNGNGTIDGGISGKRSLT